MNNLAKLKWSLSMAQQRLTTGLKNAGQVLPSLMLAGILALGMGCAVPQQADANHEQTTASPTLETPQPMNEDMSAVPDESTTSAPDEMSNEMSDETREQLQAAIAQQMNVPADQLQITRYTRETWPDGCLGLGQPNELCLMALVEGWQVEVMHDETSQFFRTDLTGSVVRPIESDDPNVVVPPSVRDRVLQTAATESGVAVNGLRLIEADTQVWDGCLGVPPTPDAACTQIAIFGWRMVVSDGSQRWVYHTNHDGSEIRLNPAVG